MGGRCEGFGEASLWRKRGLLTSPQELDFFRGQQFVSVSEARQKRALRSRKGMLVTASLNHTLTIAAKHLQNFEFTVLSIDLACNCYALQKAQLSSLITYGQ